MASITFTNAGGITVTGGINFNNVSNAIKYTSSYGTEFDMIRFKDNPDNSNGSGVVIGGGGLTVIGGGESAATIANQYSSGITEDMVVGNDGAVTVYSNLQSGWDYRKTFTFGTDGTFTATNTKATKHYVGSDGAYISYNSTTGAIEFNFA